MLKEIDRNETKSKGSPKMKRRKSMEINNSSSIQILHTNRLLQTKNKKNKRKWILCATIVYKVYSTKILFYIIMGAILGTFSFFSIFDVFQILQLETISMEFALWYELFTEVISWWTIKPSLMVDTPFAKHFDMDKLFKILWRGRKQGRCGRTSLSLAWEIAHIYLVFAHAREFQKVCPYRNAWQTV